MIANAQRGAGKSQYVMRLVGVVLYAVIVVLLCGVIGSIESHARAASVSSSANVIKVSPVRTDIQIPAGTSKTVQMTVTNLTQAPITVRPIENDFVSGDERGTPALILDENTYAPTHSLKRFMSPLTDVTIPAGQAKIVSMVITVPKEAQAGGYFGAIRFTPASLSDGGQVNLSASVASIVLLTVPGDAIEKLELTDFNIQQDGKSDLFFQSPNNLQASVRFRNTGSIQMGPFGKVSVKEGDKVIFSSDFNNKDPRDMILPDSARRWDIPLDTVSSFGYHTVVATFTYGKKNQTIELSQSFWVIPVSIVIAVVVGTIGLLIAIIGILLFFRRRKQRIQLRHHRRGGGRLRR